MKKSGRMLLTLVIPLSLIFITLMSLLLYTTHSEKYYKRLTGELLLAAANEQKDLFSVKLDGEVSLLNIISATLNARELMQSDQLPEILSAATRVSDFRNIIVTETSGRGIADDGQVLDLQGRTYLQQALRGERAMEYIAKTRLVDDKPQLPSQFRSIRMGASLVRWLEYWRRTRCAQCFAKTHIARVKRWSAIKQAISS